MDPDEEARIHRAIAAGERHRPVVIGDGLVERPAGPQAPTVHAFLRHVRAQGVDLVPAPLGLDGDRERMSYVEGESGGQGWYHQHDDRGLVSAARALRAVHDAGAAWTPPADAVWGMASAAPSDGSGGVEVVPCHGDPGPWNLVWREQEVVGIIDWDFLHLAPRVDDVAYALVWFAPLRSDDDAREWHHFPTVPDRRHRVRTFVEAYGGLDLLGLDSWDALHDAVIERMRATERTVAALAAAGVEPQATWVADGAIEGHVRERELVESLRPLVT